jgi:hypothetical protein
MILSKINGELVGRIDSYICLLSSMVLLRPRVDWSSLFFYTPIISLLIAFIYFQRNMDVLNI